MRPPRLLLLALLALMQTVGVRAQWTDATELWLRNPSFDSRIDGWNVDVSVYQNGGYQGANYYNGDAYLNGFIEVWRPGQTLGDGTMHQTVTLPRGHYRLRADAIASWQSNSWVTVEGVSLYALTQEGELFTTPMATANAAPEHFAVEFETATEGEVQLGVMIENTNANWVAADNFRLDVSDDDIVAVQSISVEPASCELLPGETLQLAVTYTPENATIKRCTYNVWPEGGWAEVDDNGLVTALSPGPVKVVVSTSNGCEAVCELNISAAAYATGVLAVNEVMSMNVDQYVDPSWNYGGWIELYNPSDTKLSLHECYVTDNPSDLCKFKLLRGGAIQPHSYYTLWFDHFDAKQFPQMVEFKLDTEGGWIAVVSPDGEIMAEATYPAGVPRTSWARATDGSDTWGTTQQPTPGTSNDGCTLATQRLEAPVVDVEAHLFTSPVTVHATWPEGSTLRYTLDGSAPTATNGDTSQDGVFYFESGYNTLRLAAVQDGYLSSPVVTNTYIYKEHDFTIPVMAVSGTDNDLFSDEMGVLVVGTNGVAGGPNTVANYYQDWERPVSFEYFAPTGERLFSQDVHISAAGGWSRTFGWHTSFKLKGAKVYEGKYTLDYPFFAEKPYLKHKTLQIRNGGNDSGCRFTDAGAQQVIGSSGIYVDYQAYQPVFHYINGRYGCVFNMREPNNKHHAYANYGLDTDFMDQFELTSHPTGGNYYEQMAGTKDTLNLLLELAAQCEDDAVYRRIGDELLDIDEYVNYMAVEIWMGIGDWITNSNNIKGFRSTEGDGRFHFVMLDMDSPFSDSNMANNATGNRNEVSQLWTRMLQNASFRKRYVDAFSLVCGSVFEPERCKAVLDRMYETVEPMMKLSGESAWGSYNSLRNNFGNGSWGERVLYNNTQGFWRVSDEVQRPVNLSFASDGASASFLYNGVDVPTGKFKGRAFLPVTVTAGAVAGYDFVGWQDRAGSVTHHEQTVLDEHAEWAYYDRGSLDGEDWKSATYDDSQWSRGNAPLGYSKDGLNTTLDYGGDSRNKYPTYYFRKTVHLDGAPTAEDNFVMQYVIDDGFVVYVNGQEAARYNMYDGDVLYDHFAISYAPGNPDRGAMVLPAGLFRQGDNAIAVEVHNNSASSTDIMWSAAITRSYTEVGEVDILSTEAALELDESMEGAELVAVYRPSSAAQPAPVLVNEVSAANDIYANDYFKRDDWFELYNATDEPVDVAGMYLSDDAEAPQKFQIPANDVQRTVIEPRSHLVVWASKRQNKGEQLHTNFKLSNTDGQTVLLTSEDGAWSSALDYDTHSGRASVGRYPDGADDVYLMHRPSIEKRNNLTSYAQYLYTRHNQAVPADAKFTLDLAEGWNWVSHPLERSIAASEINAHALRIMSQTDETARINGTWMGTLTQLAAGRGYKVQMSQDDALEIEGPLCEPAAGIYLHKGWNWIGYTLATGQSVASALARLTPAEGDVMMGRTGFATYENGAWSGTLDVLRPGAGYMYKSAAPKSLVFAQPAPSRQSVAPPFRVQPRTPWTVADAPYPDVMGLVARVEASGVADAEARYSIGAFGPDGECRGVGRWIGNRLYLTAYGNADEHLTFRAADVSTGLIYDVTEQYHFAPEVKGSRNAPVTLHVGEATDVISAKPGTAVRRVEYYNSGGLYVGSDRDTLPRGLYLVKCHMADGTTITKKTVVR